MKNHYILLILLTILFPSLALASNEFIVRPDFVQNADASVIKEGGRVLMMWLGGLITVAVICSSSYSGYLFVTGNQEEAKKWMMGIIIGVVISVFGAGIAFSVMEAMS